MATLMTSVAAGDGATGRGAARAATCELGVNCIVHSVIRQLPHEVNECLIPFVVDEVSKPLVRVGKGGAHDGGEQAERERVRDEPFLDRQDVLTIAVDGVDFWLLTRP